AAVLPTVEQIERINRQAQQEGYAAGYETGMKAGHEAGYEIGRGRAAEAAASLQALLSGFSQALAQADQNISSELLALALDLSRQMVREALRVKPEIVLAVVREIIREESAFGQPPQISLHPDDAALVREHLNQELNDCVISIDPQLERGGCRIRTGNSHVDATLQSRWRRIAQTLGQNSGWLE
ncbi:MAG: flagellar assembly protein FliH, partial [Nitrosospira sp.]|nr:flagellar assembly protein FliH [Nitrosospira sp.]